MHFDLKQPCKDCPFIPGSSTNLSLNPGRIEGIVEDVHHGNKTFACHKTTHLEDEVDWQHCAGALIHLHKAGKSNQMVQIAERLGLYDPTTLKTDVKVID